MVTETIETPLPDEGSVGIVETEFVTLFDPPGVLSLEGGAQLGPVTVAYETYGRLSAERDNAVFVCHALTGDAHAAGYHSSDSPKPGWWDPLIGPGKGLDTDKYFVICANALGGCQGTTGPSSTNSTTEKRYCRDFPVITVGDIVTVHSALVRHLGIDRLLAVIGGSLGGMQVLEWAARFPDQIRGAICLAAGPNLSTQGIAFNAVGRRAIVVDPAFQDGNYYGDPEETGNREETADDADSSTGRDESQYVGPRYGLALARMVAHITYLSEASIEMKFGRRLQHSDHLAYELETETEFQIESYLHHQGERFVERFDANSYLYLTKAMDYFNLTDSYGSLPEALGRTDARFLITSYSTDWLFPTGQSREIVRALVKAGRHVSFVELDSPYGHDSFLLETDQLEQLIGPFLEQTRLFSPR